MHRRNESPNQQEDGAWASYSGGSFSRSGNTASTGRIGQQFSDRFVPPSCSGGGFCLATQNFNVSAEDSHAVSVDAASGNVTVTNFTWNVTANLSAVTCFGNTIAASDSNYVYLITYGAATCLH